MTRSRSLAVAAAVGFLMLSADWASTPVLNAQNTPTQPVRIRVQVTQVKPDMVQQWRQLVQNEAIPAQKKGGMAWRHTWVDGGPFGVSGTFYTISPVANFAQFDSPNAITRALGADGAAKHGAKLQPLVVSNRAWIETFQTDQSIESKLKTPPPMVVVQTWQLLPGKGAEMAELWRTEFLPRYRKAGVRDVWVYAATQGAPLGQITVVRPISKYAELDQQPGLLQRGGLTPEAAAKVNARRAALVSGATTTVLRYVPELSFGMPGGATN